MKQRDDFVKVRLNEQGQRVAAGGPLRVAEGHRTFVFSAGSENEVTLFEWAKVLEPRGLFEIVTEPARTAPPAEPKAKSSDVKQG